MLIASVSAFLLLSFLVLYSYYWNNNHLDDEIYNLALSEAKSTWNKDTCFRKWATLHGGVYVKPDERTPRNPALAHLPNRDVMTTNGIELTLMNPAYMLRQMAGEFEKSYGIKEKITGKKLLNPINAADEWQLSALDLFESGKSNELIEETGINGQPYLRYMKAMYMTKSCVKCHGILGYKEGDLRGGVSVSIPLTPYKVASQMTIRSIQITHIVVWFIGIFVITLFVIIIKRYFYQLHFSIDILKKSEEKFRGLLDSAPDGMVIVDAKGKILIINQQLQKMTGYTANEINNLPIEKLIPKRFKNHKLERDSYISDPKVRAMGKNLELHVLCKDGREFPAAISLSPLDTKEELIISCAIRDLTDYKKTEESIYQFNRILESSLEEIYVFDGETLKISLVNNAAQINLGYTFEEIKQLTPLDLKPEYTYDSFLKLIGPLRTGDKEHIFFETVHKRKDESLYPVEVHLQFYKYANKNKFSAIISDISQRKEHEYELETISKQHAVVAQAGKIALSGLELNIFLKWITLVISQELKLPYCNLLQHKPNDNTLLFMANFGFMEDINNKTIPYNPDEFCSYTIHKNQPQIVVDIKTENRFKIEDFLLKENISSSLCLPVHGKEYAWGVLCVHTENHHIFKSTDVVFLKSMANIIGSAIEKNESERVIKEDDTRLHNMLDSMFTFVGVIDFDGILIDANKALLERASLSREDVIGKYFFETYWWSYSTEVQSRLNSALAQAKEGHVVRYDEVVRMGESNYSTVDVCFGPLTDSDGNIIKIIASAADVTDRVTVENRLQESEERLAFATIGSNDGLWDRYIGKNETWWSSRVYEFLGYEEEEIESTFDNFTRMIHPEDKERVDIALNDHINLNVPYNINFRMKIKSGDYRWFNNRGQVIRDVNIKPHRMAGTIRDITERIKQAENIKNKTIELEQSKNSLRQLSAKIERIREEELATISREVHDKLGHAFTALKFDVFWLKRTINSRNNDINKKLDEMSVRIDSNTNLVREIASELRPPVLDDLGLNAAIEWYCYDIKQKLGLEYEHNIEVEEKDIPLELKTVLFRIFQEAITNIVRHAKTEIYWVNLKYFDNHLTMQIIDNGIGIDERKLSHPSSLGILGMSERIQSYGGTVKVRNYNDHTGTEVYVDVPYLLKN